MPPFLRLKFERQRQGLTQTQLATRACVPQTTISAIEIGRVNPSPEELEALGGPCGIAPPSTLKGRRGCRGVRRRQHAEGCEVTDAFSHDVIPQRFSRTDGSDTIASCLICGRKKIVMVGVFAPTSDAMRAVVLRLRTHVLKGQSTPCIDYGLCRRHATDPDAIGERVEAALCAASERVRVQ